MCTQRAGRRGDGSRQTPCLVRMMVVAKKSKSSKSGSTPAKRAAKKTVKKAKKKKIAAKTAKKTTKRTAKKTVKKAAKKAAAKATTSSAPEKVKLKSPLRKAQLEKFRQMLLEKRRTLLGDMSGIEAETIGTNRKGGATDLSNMPTHPADLGTDNYEHEFSLGLLESERALLSEIDEALERINDRTFGVCPGTGKPIGLARLQARPWSRYCIDYARMVEKGLVRPADEDERT